MKKLLSGVWAAFVPSLSLAGLRAAALAGAAMLSVATASAADRVVAQIDWLPSGDKAPFYVALHEGFFAQEGLEVTLQTGRGSADALTKVATGVADIASSGLSAVLSAAAKDPIPLKVVYTVYTEAPDSFFVVKGSGIRTLKDLQGRAVAATALSTSRVLMPLVLERNGLSMDQMKLQLVDANVLMPMLASGRVDAISSFRTQLPLANSLLKPRGKEVEALPWSSFGLETYGMVLAASDTMIKERPEVLKRFLRAFHKAVLLSLKDPAVAGRALKKSAPEIDPAVAEAQFRASMPLIDNAISQRDGIGTIEPGLLKKSWGWVAASEHYPADKIDPEKVVSRIKWADN
ncbi:MAG: ABC transporter substrate-binding protein [Pigmentiphaga sp.]|uniref:ABC transporter substrate-binding protein n=1 Tax=Pigmentiphaga sp. TaxID=1977564 RepID=UPI0029B87501|nr:ABC transporter substrate-binding protein [Pigmentiphaga sp.]MDX3907423.1 ABC transporter substrate-binding protein [Pigmentiphaga sp.]